MRHFLIVVLIFGVSACKHREVETKGSVVTEIRSYVDAAAQGKRYTNFVVSVPIENVIFRGFLEDSIASELLRYDVVAVQFTRLFPPTRQYSESEVKSVIMDYDFSTLLVVTVVTNQVKEVGIATASSAKTSGGSVTSIFGSAYGVSPGTAYGSGLGITSGSSKTTGKSVSRILGGRDITVDTALHDIKTQSKLWIASLSTHAEEGSKKGSKELISEKEIAKNISKKIVSKLKQDGLF